MGRAPRHAYVLNENAHLNGHWDLLTHLLRLLFWLVLQDDGSLRVMLLG